MGIPITPSPENKQPSRFERETLRQQEHVDKLRDAIKKRIGQLFRARDRLFRIGETVAFQTSPRGRSYQGVIAGWNKKGNIVIIRVGTKKAYAVHQDDLGLIHQARYMPMEENNTANIKLSEIAKGHAKGFQHKVSRLVKKRRNKNKNAA